MGRNGTADTQGKAESSPEATTMCLRPELSENYEIETIQDGALQNGQYSSRAFVADIGTRKTRDTLCGYDDTKEAYVSCSPACATTTETSLVFCSLSAEHVSGYIGFPARHFFYSSWPFRGNHSTGHIPTNV